MKKHKNYVLRKISLENRKCQVSQFLGNASSSCFSFTHVYKCTFSTATHRWNWDSAKPSQSAEIPAQPATFANPPSKPMPIAVAAYFQYWNFFHLTISRFILRYVFMFFFHFISFLFHRRRRRLIFFISIQKWRKKNQQNCESFEYNFSKNCSAEFLNEPFFMLFHENHKTRRQEKEKNYVEEEKIITKKRKIWFSSKKNPISIQLNWKFL